MTSAFYFFILSFTALLWSGKVLPSAIHGIARIMHISEFLIGFFFVALATSIPELFVGVSSAIQGVPDISLGNVLGANFINLTLVIGLSALIAGKIDGNGKISSENYWITTAIAFLPILLAGDGVISRLDGILLLAAFALYIRKILRDKKYFPAPNHKGEPVGFHSIPSVLKHLAYALASVTILIASSFVLVWSTKTIVQDYFHSEFIFFGFVFLAVGTTLPELVFGIRSAITGNSSVVLGNTIGTISFNAAGVLGIVSILEPIKLDFFRDIFINIAFLIAAFVLFHFFAYTKSSVNRKEGALLLLIYILFLALTFALL